MSRTAHLRALRCDRGFNTDGLYYLSLRDLLEYLWNWERDNGPVCGAIGWERQILGAEAEGMA